MCEQSAPGDASFENSSIKFSFNPGRIDAGFASPLLWVHRRTPHANLSTPASLRIDYPRLREGRFYGYIPWGGYGLIDVPGLEVLPSGAGYGGTPVKQVKTYDAIANVVSDSQDPYEYTVEFYTLDQITGIDENTDLYEFSGTPFVSWHVENPDGASAINRLRISKVVNSTSVARYDYEYDASTSKWTLTMGDGSGNPIRSVITWRTHDAVDEETTVHEQVNEGTVLVYEAERTYDWTVSNHLTLEKIGPAANPMIVTRTYWHNAGDWRRSRLKSVLKPDGGWAVRDYEYNPTGDWQSRLEVELKSWKDIEMPSESEIGWSVLEMDDDYYKTLYWYGQHTDPQNSGKSDSGYFHSPRTITESVAGTVVRKTFAAFLDMRGTNWDPDDPNNPDLLAEREVREQVVDVSYGFGNTGNLRTTIDYFGAEVDSAGGVAKPRIKSITFPDGRKDYHTAGTGISEGIWYSGDPTQGTQGGFLDVSDGPDTEIAIIHSNVDSPNGIAYKTLGETIYLNNMNQVLSRKQWVPNVGVIGWTSHIYDQRGRLIHTWSSNGRRTDYTWPDAVCCQQATTTDETGIQTTFAYDPLGRLTSRTKIGVSGTGSDDILTEIERTTNSFGYVETATRSNGTLELATSVEYDTAGRVIKTVDTAGLATTYAYGATTLGGKKVTVTRPGDATEVTEYYRDGRIKSLTGTSVVHTFYKYGVNQDGSQWTCVWKGDAGTNPGDPDSWTANASGPGSAEWAETTTYDMVGRVRKTQRPGHSSTLVTTEHFYNPKGQLVRTTTTGSAPTIYEYDDLGEVWRSGLDLPPYAQVDQDGNYQLDPESDDRITETERYYEYTGGNDRWQVTKTKVYPTADDDESLITVTTTRRRLSGHGAGVIEETVVIDANDNETKTTVSIDREDKEITRTVDPPDSSFDEVTLTRNGLLISSTSKTYVETIYGYDALGRQSTITDPRTGMTTTTYDSAGRVWKIQLPDENIDPTEYGYDESTGEQIWVKNALGNYQRFEYTDRGELKRTWGETTYPVEYGYDSRGRRTKMWTWRDTTVNWASSTWPDPDPGDKTEWIYEPGTGLLLEKQYADHTPQAPRNIEYTYTDEGKLESRTWSRPPGSSRLTTIYTYDPDTGELTDIDYFYGTSPDPDTPSVTFEYDRLGRQKKITDALGTREFTYNDDPNTGDLQLLTEAIGTETGDLYSKLITRIYEPSTGGEFVRGRNGGLSIGPDETHEDEDYYVEYLYNNSTSGGTGRLVGIGGPGLHSAGMFYSYAGDSDLVDTIGYRGDSSDEVITHIEYDAYRDLVAHVESIRDPDGTPSTISKYEYANDGVGRRSSAKMTGSAFSSARHWRWGYNDRSEVTTADRCDTTTLTGNCTHMTPGDYDYTYDPIGNRTEATKDSAETHYCANNINQYKHTHDGTDNCPNPTSPTESFVYDEDGNLVQDAGYEYLWDAENRLITVIPNNPVNGSQAAVYTYDYMGRRVEKQVYTYNNGWGDPPEILRFVYDQWNVVLVLDENNDVVKKYTWGLDLSGQRSDPTASGIHNAGGIGGLLAVEETAASGSPEYWFLYDANGNVGQIVENATNYSLTAHYEYDAYGHAIVANDVDSSGYVDINPFRFSTKWFDEGSALGYWGERYYEPKHGRWLNRDPIAETGGDNLYAFTLNTPSNFVDPVGEQNWGYCFGGGIWDPFEKRCKPVPPRPPGPGPGGGGGGKPSTCSATCSGSGAIPIGGGGCIVGIAGRIPKHPAIIIGGIVCACLNYIIAEEVEEPAPSHWCTCHCPGYGDIYPNGWSMSRYECNMTPGCMCRDQLN